MKLSEYKNCLICGNSSVSVWAKLDVFTAVQCSVCNFVWINPMPDEASLNEYYSNYHESVHTVHNRAVLRQQQYILDRDYILKFLPKLNSYHVLDVGCAAGYFLDTFNDRFNKCGTEIDPTAAKIAKEKYGDNVLNGKLTDFQSDKKFDLVMMRGVIEHLLEPNLYMEKVITLLKDDGLFYITATPNVDSFCAHVYREKWNQFVPGHLLYFSDKTIATYLSKFGLKIIAKDFPYLDTPYANVNLDNKAMFDACVARQNGTFDSIEGKSRAFWGNMMSVVARKV